MGTKKKRKRKPQNNMLVLKLLVLVVIVLVLFEGKLIYTMFTQGTSSTVTVSSSSSESEKPQNLENEPLSPSAEAVTDSGNSVADAPLAGLSIAVSGASASTALQADQETEDPYRISEEIDSPAVVKEQETAIDDSYFSDAVFIGDSRIEGLHDYGTLRTKTTADFYYKDGVSIWDLMDKTMANGETVSNALASKQYKKIFIMCGVNELGSGYAKDYQAQYKKVLDQIQELQPDAVIFVMGMMHVTQSYADNSDVYNNDNVDCRNALVAEYADGQHIFYLDMNTCVCDMDGDVPMGVKADYSNDGIHLQAQYYSLWEAYLLKHGVSDSVFTNLQNK